MDYLHVKLRKVAHYLYMIMYYDARFVPARSMGATEAADDVTSVTGEAKRRAGWGGGRARHHAEGRRGEPQQGKQDDQQDDRTGAEKRPPGDGPPGEGGSSTRLRRERPDRTVGERLRLPGTIKEKGSKLTAGFERSTALSAGTQDWEERRLQRPPALS